MILVTTSKLKQGSAKKGKVLEQHAKNENTPSEKPRFWLNHMLPIQHVQSTLSDLRT